jgi:hypothetical protein
VVGRAGMTKTGPDDARHVVWALGESFFIIIHSFSILNDFYRYYGYYRCTDGLMGDSDDENGSKRRQTRRLDPR